MLIGWPTRRLDGLSGRAWITQHGEGDDWFLEPGQRLALPGDLRELVIMRVAYLNGAPYEADQHAPIALREGVSQAQLDALREVANIGAGHAATALSQMVGQPIMISVPRVNVAPLEEVPNQIASGEEPVAAVLGPSLVQTAKLMILTFVLSISISIVLGCLAAVRPGG